MAALRFRKAKDGKPKRRFLMGVHPVPTLVTLGNLLCGFAAIILAMRAHQPPTEWNLTTLGCLNISALLIFAAMVFDAMDGRVARWTKSSSKFGMEMDSLCDVVSFGVAPAVLVKALIDYASPTIWPESKAFPILDRYVWLMMAVYVSCAALRLARYNVEAETGHRDFFFGIPSPAAAGCVASLVVMLVPMMKPQFDGIPADKLPNAPLYLWIGVQNFASIVNSVLYALPFLMLCLGILMVSRVHYIHVGDRLLRGRKSFMHLLIVCLGLVLIILQHEIMLALAFNGFAISGLFNEVRYQLFPSQRPAEWIEAAKMEAALMPGSSASLAAVPPETPPPSQTADAAPEPTASNPAK